MKKVSAITIVRIRARVIDFGLMLLLVVFALLLSGCKPSRFVDSVQQNVSPAELESWATNAIAKGVITTNGTSEALQKIIREGRVSFSTEARSSERIVVLVYGGGFGHWGIAAGAPSYICTLGNAQKHWTNGIWFWNE